VKVNSYGRYDVFPRTPQVREPAPGLSYSGFDYRAAYGADPFAPTVRKVNQDVETMRSRVAGMSAGPTDKFLPRFDDPEIKDYMANALSGQRSSLDDYVRRAAGASIRRGGVNVLGGPDLESSLHHNAMKTLAAGYGQRFGDAVNYSKYKKNAQYGQYSDSIRNLQHLLELQKGYVSSQAGWRERLGQRRQQDWRLDVDQNREAADRATGQAPLGRQFGLIGPAQQTGSAPRASGPAGAPPQSDPVRDLQQELLRQQVDMQRHRDIWEKEDRQRALDDLLTRQGQWGQTQVIQSDAVRKSSSKQKDIGSALAKMQ
jgi:hypothetical protein